MHGQALTNASNAQTTADSANTTANSALTKATANETTITEYLTDSDWETPTLDTSRFKYDSYTRNKYRQIGKLVMVDVVVEPLADINANSNIIDILSGLPAPSYLIQIATMQVLNNTPIRITIDTTGKVSAYYNGTLTLLANRAIPLTFMYLVD